MTLDEEDDRQILLQLIDQAAFSGRVAEIVVRLKNAIRDAKVESANDDLPAGSIGT